MLKTTINNIVEIINFLSSLTRKRNHWVSREKRMIAVYQMLEFIDKFTDELLRHRKLVDQEEEAKKVNKFLSDAHVAVDSFSKFAVEVVVCAKELTRENKNAKIFLSSTFSSFPDRKKLDPLVESMMSLIPTLPLPRDVASSFREEIKIMEQKEFKWNYDVIVLLRVGEEIKTRSESLIKKIAFAPRTKGRANVSALCVIL